MAKVEYPAFAQGAAKQGRSFFFLAQPSDPERINTAKPSFAIE
jgi:hypothetical protein